MKGLGASTASANVDPSWRIGIVASLWHREIIDALIEGARKTLTDAGIPEQCIAVYDAPGSFEVPLIGAALMDKVDALIGFGIILQGETFHAQALAQTTSQAMMDLQVRHAKPFAFEILHVHSIDQARERSMGEQNKGAEAALAVLKALETLKRIGEG